MTDARGEELLAAIRAAPHDRTLRLVYADWLMERGDPRGEWIALACGQATENTDQEMRRRALWQHHGRQWEADDRSGSGLDEISYRDGLPHTARLASGTHVPPRTRYPLDTLHVTTVPGALGALAASPLLETVRCVHLEDDRESTGNYDELVAFLQAPALERLEEIAIGAEWSTRHVFWHALAQFRRLAALKRLDINGTISSKTIDLLGRSCPALETLRYSPVLWNKPLSALKTATFRLRQLSLRFAPNVYEPSRDGTISDVLASPPMHGLTHLEVQAGGDGAHTAAAFAQLPCTSTLRHLIVDNAEIIRGLHLCQLPVLETLGIAGLDAADDLAGPVARFPTLTALEVKRAVITPSEIVTILSSLPRLERLALDNCVIRDDSVHAIAWSEQARSLRHLSLDNSGLGSDAIASIMGSDHLNELRSLSLRADRLDPVSLRALANGPFDRMERLCLNGSTHEFAPLFAAGWLPRAEAGTYERKLELSGRAVAR